MAELLVDAVRRLAGHRCECRRAHDHKHGRCERVYQGYLYPRPDYGPRVGKTRNVMVGRIIPRIGRRHDSPNPKDWKLVCERCVPKDAG